MCISFIFPIRLCSNSSNIIVSSTLAIPRAFFRERVMHYVYLLISKLNVCYYLIIKMNKICFIFFLCQCSYRYCPVSVCYTWKFHLDNFCETTNISYEYSSFSIAYSACKSNTNWQKFYKFVIIDEPQEID
jgi:hypothetical protein